MGAQACLKEMWQKRTWGGHVHILKVVQCMRVGVYIVMHIYRLRGHARMHTDYIGHKALSCLTVCLNAEGTCTAVGPQEC